MNPRGPFKSAFTLVELLVVIAVIGILAALLLSALSAAKERAVRVRCLNNIKQYSLASLSYAHDNNDRFPRVGDPSIPLAGYGFGSVAHNIVNVTISDIFTRQYGLTPSIFYDPGIPKSGRTPRVVDWAPLGWRYVNEDLYSETSSVEGFGPIKSRFTGYVHTFGALSMAPTPIYTLDPTNWNLTTIPQPRQVGSLVLPAPKSSERALVAGLIPFVNVREPVSTKPYYAYEGVLDHSTPANITNFDYFLVRPAHLAQGKNKSPGTPTPEPWDSFFWMVPAGDNVGFLDGSARWRNFKDMTRHGSSRSISFDVYW